LVVSNEHIVTAEGVAVAIGIGLTIILVVAITCAHPAAEAIV
jgi:CBS-domain-containing membrane protein